MSQPPESNDAPVDAALASLEPGFLVGNGRFTLVRLIGRGGMGVVWLARDESLREDVALKFLPPEIRFDAVALDDLRRETARARKLTHPNIIRIHDIYKDEREAFISMEYIDGPNLGDLRIEKPERVFTWEFLEPLVKQLCEALDYAHGEKVIHRDLKPANMMLDSRGRLKLSDFGIAAQVSDSVSRVSMIRHGQSGTITYMSPQQMDGKLPQVSDDIYALGATLYELLTSRPPFFTGDIAHQVRNLLPQPIEERLEELGIANPVPKPVAAMIMACLGKIPEQRPASARAVAEWIGLRPATPAQEPAATTARASVDSHGADSLPRMTTPSSQTLSTAENNSPAIASAPLEPPLPREPLPEWGVHAPTAIANTAPSRWLWISALAAVLTIAGLAIGLLAWWLYDRSQHRTASAPPENIPATVATTEEGAGFLSLFNGRDLTGWSGDSAIWSVENGVIRGRVRNQRTSAYLLWQGEAVTDFELRAEFRRLGGNSGVFYRAKMGGSDGSSYQFDMARNITGNLIWHGDGRRRRDLFRVDSAEARRAGINMEPGPGWHELTIIARGSQLIHRLDDKTLCDVRDTETDAPRSGSIALEISWDTTVEFRNLRLKRFTADESPITHASAGQWTTLFNGTSLDSWQPWKANSWIGSWSILDDELRSLRGGAINLATREQYGDFELELEWKVTPGANSGILYRALPTASEVWRAAPEYQIIDDPTHRDGQTPNTSAASLYGLISPTNKNLKLAGEFNRTRIVARGSHVEHWLNGVKVLETDLARSDIRRVATQRFKQSGWGQEPRGHIVLQHLGSEVSFRNIRVRRLDAN
jgi:serine/threonine protein kinase